MKFLPERFVYVRVLTYSREYEGTLGGGLLERNVFQLYIRYCESSKSLEGDWYG